MEPQKVAITRAAESFPKWEFDMMLLSMSPRARRTQRAPKIIMTSHQNYSSQRDTIVNSRLQTKTILAQILGSRQRTIGFGVGLARWLQSECKGMWRKGTMKEDGNDRLPAATRRPNAIRKTSQFKRGLAICKCSHGALAASWRFGYETI